MQTETTTPPELKPIDWDRPLFGTNGRALTVTGTLPDGRRVLLGSGEKPQTTVADQDGNGPSGKRVVFNKNRLHETRRSAPFYLDTVKPGDVVYRVGAGRRVKVEPVTFVARAKGGTRVIVLPQAGAQATVNAARIFRSIEDVRKYALALLKACDDLLPR
jgi:hypothetical protein